MRFTTASTRQSLAMINLSYHLTETDSDDSSTSSTIAVASLLKAAESCLLEQTTFAKKNKKMVRFSEHDNKSYNNTVLFKEDCQEFWYSAAEYTHFKLSTKFLAQEIARLEKRNKKSANSYRAVLERTYEASASTVSGSISSSNVEQDAKQLEEWMRVTTCRLGLERLAIRSIAMDRSQRRADLVDMVLELQHEGSAKKNDATQAELLRQASEELSRTSRLFAQHLAVALQNSYTYSSS